MADDVLQELVAFLRTKDALADLNKRIDHALLELSAGDVAQLPQYLSSQEYTILQKGISKLEDLHAIRARLAQVEVFTVQLGFRPNAFFEYTLQQMILKAVKEPCVVNIVTVKQILGGATVDYKGTYRDYSLKSAIGAWRERKQLTTNN